MDEEKSPQSDIEGDISQKAFQEEGDNISNGEITAAVPKSGNSHLRRLIDLNFLEYASYVIKDRAIPDADDGLKPVQRRILWSLFRIDDGKFHKVANVIGHAMQYHPHGDASIFEALVVLANKEYFIEKQGNFGNIYTGDPASAARYIECRLTPLAKEVLFNNDITEFVDSYDGRNKEPVFLPSKVPALLLLGAEGIAVGMSTRILPHNFRELLEAQISVLRKEKFSVYPDFLQGGVMDVSDYNDGNGKVTLRAKIEKSGRKLIIREIPAVTTTDRIISSIENAARRNKIKISSINDYTAEHVEIEITPVRGYDPGKALKALYAYTDCSISITANLIVIVNNRPVQMSVSEMIKRNTEMLMRFLQKELEIELSKLQDSFHEKTLAQIFIENRIYKRIEQCESYELVLKEVRAGLKKFKDMLKREISEEDIEKLLAIPIRKISLFDINKNKKDIKDIVEGIENVQKNLKRLRAYTIKYLQELIKKYADKFPRRTDMEAFDKIDVRKVALNNVKVGWDRKECYVGTSVKSDETVTCNEYDRLLCIERSGKYKIINIPEKIFTGRLLDFRKYDKETEFALIYRDKKTEKCYAKRTVIDKFITDKEYNIVPPGSRLEILTTRTNSIYECLFEPKPRQKQGKIAFDFSNVSRRSPRARGFLISSKKVESFRYLGGSEDLPEKNENVAELSAPEPESVVVDKEKTADKIKTEDKPSESLEKKSEKPVYSPPRRLEPKKKTVPPVEKEIIGRVEIPEPTRTKKDEAGLKKVKKSGVRHKQAPSKKKEIKKIIKKEKKTGKQRSGKIKTEGKIVKVKPSKPEQKTKKQKAASEISKETKTPKKQVLKRGEKNPVKTVKSVEGVKLVKGGKVVKRVGAGHRGSDDNDFGITQPELNF